MSVNSSKFSWRGLWEALGHGAWALFAIMGVAGGALTVLLIVLVQYLSLDEATLMQPEWTLGLYAAQYALGLGAIMLIPVVAQKRTKQQLRSLFGVLRQPVANDIGLAFLAFLPYFAASIAVQSLIAAIVPGYNADQTQDVGFSDLDGTWQLVLAFIALVVLAPLAEELIFRGYIFGNARRHLGFWPSAIITSILFGLVHGQWNVALDTFVLSIALCYLRERTGAIWASVFLHAIKNGLAYTLLFIFRVG